MPQVTPYKVLKDYTLTTPGGCKIVVNGDLGIVAGTFTGTVTISGKSCPITGTFEFKSATAPSYPIGHDLTMSFDKKDIAEVSKITWSGNSEVAKLLNEETVNRELCGFIRTNINK